MPVPFACKGCGFKTNVKDTMAGKKIKCPKCGAPGAIPALNAGDDGDDDIMKLDLGSFQDVEPAEGENIDGSSAAPKAPKKKKKKSAAAPLSSGVKGAAVLFSLLSVAVIALLVMTALPEILAKMEPKEQGTPAAKPAAENSKQ